MSAEFVPAVDHQGEAVWLSPGGEVFWFAVEYVPAEDDWRRLGYMQPVEHPDLQDCDGDVWKFIGVEPVYEFGCIAARSEIESDYGPVTEVDS